ncbi:MULTISPECIES: Asp23/Gls24 family envelope stress response protein [unclassified Microbacterium]|uniref:Asp23/Gls24 family envelope stress response protein n=1 Tax=unclassified Microbacterium TaxID=2609290 RepID=UPI0006FF3F32|nr:MULTISPECIES: Asp23/Gls24 family envelope stress response protein [unclassified Microbacterium]AOX47400.1 alkaline-shock protein [Microbacterium sp. BH-3-3-3]KQR86992.1 alkaline-shock protein [Microbacterium sp. Leaf179]KQT72307.1 alkaline-shock protein [Microbacterium sp. Leaf436]MBD8206544.1 Asp23/Gls24 family envelope stress response protein [Microbacterium sp. CFBP 8801]MBD8219398.1 Asp23/Gls24 family envelope stress response protein [Microbacterium sp. CFBP 13617]
MASTDTPTPATRTDARRDGGTTVIVDPVVAKVAGIAAAQVPGVHALGGGAARVIGNIRQAVGAKDYAQGVSVEVGETEVAADISIQVDYPERIQRVAANVRSAVQQAITEIVGMKAVEVNVTVVDVFIPGDDEDEQEEARVN